MIPERSGAYEPKTLAGEIAFDRVEFGYAKDAPVLRGVSFVIQRGRWSASSVRPEAASRPS